MPHQRQMHQNKSKFLICVTGRQIGKTIACVNEIIKRAVKYPYSRNWYITNDYKQAKRNVWDLFKYYVVPQIGAQFNSSELSILFPNKSKIELIGVENAESLRGAAVHFQVLDEYADFPRDIWPKVLRPMFSTTNGDAWFVGSPKGIGNDLYDKYITDNLQTTKLKIPACELYEGKVIKTTSKYASIEELQSAYDADTTPTKEYFNQEYMAQFTRPSGTVYGEWPLENFRDVPYEHYLPLHISMDFGVNDPTAIIWIQPHKGEYRVIDYYEASNANVSHFASVIRSKPYKQPELFTGDEAGHARTLTTGTSVIQDFATHGIHIRTTPGLRIPDQIRTTHKNIKVLYVNNKLERFRDCILNYRYPNKKETVIDQSNEIPIHDQWSHAMRALEYYFVNASGYQRNEYQKYNTAKWKI